MKIVLTYLKIIVTILVFLMVFQSCKVYQKQPVSLLEAVTSEKKVRVVYLNAEKYAFCKLILNEERLYGVTKIHSRTAKKLDTCIVNCSVDGKVVKIKLQKEQIQDIFLLDKK
jgi:hypothetical protein